MPSIPPPVVVLECRCDKTVVGELVYVVGSCRELGNWNIEEAFPLSTSPQQFPKWLSCAFVLSDQGSGEKIEFKFFIKDERSGRVVWETGSNRVIRCPDPGHLARVKAEFDNTSNLNVSITVTSDILVEQPPPAIPILPQASIPHEHLSPVSYVPPIDTLTGIRSFSVEAIQKLIVSTHKSTSSFRERINFVLNVLSSQPSSTIEMLRTVAFVSLYWYWISTAQVPCEEDGRHFRPNHIANSSEEIYRLLDTFMKTHRTDDSHLWAFDCLEMIVRWLLRYLPSFDSAFTAAVPMTRIRDIAHRSDIPHEVKQEIKTRLQNKLHRCMSPSDLAVCRELLQRYRDMNLSGDFIKEFEIFEKELSKFFNLHSIHEKLEEIVRTYPGACPKELGDQIEGFVKALNDSKHEHCEGIYGYNVESVLNRILCSFNCALQLRRALNDVQHSTVAHMQLCRVTEIELECTSNTLLSRLNNILSDSQVVNDFTIRALTLCLQGLALSGIAKPLCRLLLGECATLLSNVKDADLHKILSESLAQRIVRLCAVYSDFISAVFDIKEVEHLAKEVGAETLTNTMFAESFIRESFIFQVSRLADNFCQNNQLSHYMSLSDGVSQGLLIHVENLWNDAELSAAILAKLPKNSGSTNNPAGCPTIRMPSRCGSGNPSSLVNVILAVDRFEGEEEIEYITERLHKNCVPVNIAGILCKHELPILSHLGVRVRQKRLPFVCIISPSFNWSETISAADGKPVEMNAHASPLLKQLAMCPNKLTILPIIPNDSDYLSDSSSSPSASPSKSKRNKIRGARRSTATTPSTTVSGTPALIKASSLEVLSGSAITAATCGNKAAVCAKLQLLLHENVDCHLKAPPCLALPFGTLNAALRWPINAEGKTRFDVLRRRRQGRPDMCVDMQRIILDLALPREELQKLRNAIAIAFLSNESAVLQSQRLALYVRSSCSAEDTSTDAAAGIFESVTTTVTWRLPPSGGFPILSETLQVNDLWMAIKQVWASLYAPRAMELHANKHCEMGVLIQPVVNANWSFYAHTRAPSVTVSGNSLPFTPEESCYVEIAKGLGESLAGGGRTVGGGQGSRLLVSRQGDVDIRGMWNMWGAVQADIIPYFDRLSDEEMTKERWVEIGQKLKHIFVLQDLLGAPQDVEGCIVNGCDVFIVQSRCQTDV